MSIAQDIQNAIGQVSDQESFIQGVLVDTLHWELDPDALDIEDTAYEYTADELNSPLLDEKCNGRALQLTFQSEIPWGVFLIEFHSEEPFVQSRGLTMPLRQLLNALVPKRRRDSGLPAWDRENLLFICTHDYRHFRFAYFQAAPGKEKTAPLKLFGWNESDTAVRTLCEHNLQKLLWDDVQDWSEAFNIEKVTKEFYRDYADVFRRMEDTIGEHNDIDGDDLRMFTQMLFNRLMFLRFIERKGWLEFGDTPDYLANLFASGGIDGQSFYASRLMPLFFEGLAVEGKQESPLIGRVPFLNGGLFERADLDDQVDDIPDEAFSPVLGPRGLFYRYNFTISESTPLDIEVAVDPEMLGKVFEELVTGRHESGSYYTPRPVVAFMCREALKGYLAERIDVPADAVALLVDQHDASGLLRGQREPVEKAIKALKACDPACGSGAYLLGLMQEIISILKSLESDKLRDDPKYLYNLKLYLISHNLYGVDIDAFATNIAMLRLWLSLSVEADAPEPLPNLDFKIETGDSLLGECDSILGRKGMYGKEIDEITFEMARLVADHVKSHDPQEKARLASDIAEKKGYLKGLFGITGQTNAAIVWPAEFPEVFAPRIARPNSNAADGEYSVTETVEPGGFDLVLANPPYVRQELIAPIKPDLRAQFPDVYAGTADLYVYFYARAVQMLRDGGVLSFIAPNKFFRAGYGKKLRTFLTQHTALLDLLDFGDYPIFQAITYPSIIVAQKRGNIADEWTVPSLNWPADEELTAIADVHQAQATHLQQNTLSDDSWRIVGSHVARVMARLRASGESLNALTNGGLFYGIKTGRNDVFEIDEATRSELIAQDDSSSELIRPWLRGRNVARWAVNWDGKYLLFTRRGINIDAHPAVRDYLARFRERIEPRPSGTPSKGWKGRKPGSYRWYEIQDAIDYWREFEKPKIVYQVIATYQQFAYTAEPFVSNDKTWIIPDPPEGLLGLLNSKVAWFFLDQIAPKLQGGAFELRSPYMGQIPVPELSQDLVVRTHRIIELVADDDHDEAERWQLEQEIDEIVVGLYGLDVDDVKVIDEAVEAAGNRFPRKFRESEAYKDYVAEMFGEE